MQSAKIVNLTIKQLLHRYHKILALCNIKGELASSFSRNIAHSVVLCCVVLCCVALRCVALRCVALRCVALRCVVDAITDNYFCLIHMQAKMSKRGRKRVDYDHCRHVVDVSISFNFLMLVIEHSENKINSPLNYLKTRSDLECSSPAFNKQVCWKNSKGT